MGFASYFDKNVQAASLLLRDFSAESFKRVLERETIAIVFDSPATESFEGKALLDLLTRLVSRLFPSITIVSLGGPANRVNHYRSLAKEINPNIEINRSLAGATRCLIVGPAKVRASARTRIYLGSDNWLVKLSTTRPVEVGRSRNPLGAGAAACLGMANVFRAIFHDELGGAALDKSVNFSLLDLDPRATTPTNSPLKDVDIGEVHLVGAGAIGNGFLWVLSQLECRGVLHVIDAETIELSNLQRYALTRADDEGKYKALLAGKWLQNRKLQVVSHTASWETFMSERKDWKLERVAVAVDSAVARVRIQASLPQRIFNSWTQGGEVGISRHTFLRDACLACLYLPKGKSPNLDEIVLKALRLEENDGNLRDIRARLDTGQPTDRAFLERVSTGVGIPVDRLLAYEGRPLHKLYVEAVCGGAVLEFNSGGAINRAEVPMAFQSALAGIMLAGDVLADVGRLRRPLPTISQIDLLRPLPLIISTPRQKDAVASCFCRDIDFITQYRAKYTESTPAKSLGRIKAKQQEHPSRPRKARLARTE